jgi:hypothetical protein
MAGETTTPNIGLQIAGFDQPNWQVPTNYNWNLLDLIFGGEIQVPALDVNVLTVASFVIANFVASAAASFFAETPGGTVPGTVYTCTYIPGVVLGVYKNGIIQKPGVGYDYTISGNQITFSTATSLGDKIYVTYFH